MEVDALKQDINLLKSKEGYIKAGYPGFMGLFGRDSLITAWQLLDYDPMIARNTLFVLSKLQGKKTIKATGEELGKILHEYYPENMDVTDYKFFNKYKSHISWLKPGRPVYFSIDSTPLFRNVLNLYYSKTGDDVLWHMLNDSLGYAYSWIFTIQKKYDGLIGYEKTKALMHQSWKDSSSYKIKYPVFPVEVQGYTYSATKNGGFKQNLHLFWMKELNYFCFALDGDREQVKEVTSNPGHLLFTGILDKKQARMVVKKLFSEELWTPYGIRTLSVNSDWFDAFSYHNGSVWPHDNWVIAQGLKKYGFKRQYEKIKKALYKAYHELGYIPEYYGVTIRNQLLKLPACNPQAWASGALLNFKLEDYKR